jgi:hypothetical protein
MRVSKVCANILGACVCFFGLAFAGFGVFTWIVFGYLNETKPHDCRWVTWFPNPNDCSHAHCILILDNNKLRIIKDRQCPPSTGFSTCYVHDLRDMNDRDAGGFGSWNTVCSPAATTTTTTSHPHPLFDDPAQQQATAASSSDNDDCVRTETEWKDSHPIFRAWTYNSVFLVPKECKASEVIMFEHNPKEGHLYDTAYWMFISWFVALGAIGLFGLCSALFCR